MPDRRDYHPYVFDPATRTFVGAFEAMYAAEKTGSFDSWHQDDPRHLGRRLAAAVLADYNFARVLDVGCGKGTFTQTLKRANNEVVGLDLSETAIATAQARYPDIEFRCADVSAPGALLAAAGGRVDLVVSLETLSYLARWRDVLAECAAAGRYVLVGLYLPEDPIGFVKSFEELADAFAASCRVLECIRLEVRRQIVLFGERLEPSTR
ncbi:MAG TPA: class I SAM-dependent methyltransferase [Dehalococcoidia bacterium]|nr:class I SAM-dependent methyltransferase [Dehalococcoidia bacterium]